MVDVDPRGAAPHEQREQMLAQVERSEEAENLRRSETRRVLYKDVEDMLNTGFLAHQVRIAGTSLSIRSLCPGDVFLLRHRVGLPASNRLWKIWAIASSVWMVNGINLLPDAHAPERLYRSFEKLPGPTLDVLFSLVAGMFNRTGMAITRTEPYCYEPYSRSLWRFFGRSLADREGITGIPGSGLLGMNHVQRMWQAFNIAEDDRLQHIQDWQGSKLVASAMSPKGIKKLNRADEALQKRETSRRREALDLMVKRVLYGDEDPGTGTVTVMIRGEPVVVPYVQSARTEDELAEQMRMWVAGEKDWHDMVVDDYKNRIRRQFAEEKRVREERMSELQRRPGVTSAVEGLVAYTPEQIREFRPELFQHRGAKKVMDGSVPAVLFDKYIANDPQPGRLKVDDFGVREATPGDGDLQEEVSKRRPQLSSQPMNQPRVRGES